MNDIVALAGLGVGALGLIISWLVSRSAAQSAEQLERLRWQREDDRRRTERAESTANDLILRLDELRHTFEYRRDADKPTRLTVEPYRDALVLAAEKFPEPVRAHLRKSAELVYEWDDDKAYDANLPWALVIETVADAGRAVLGAFTRGDPSPAIERFDALYGVHERVDAEWRAQMDEVMREEREKRVGDQEQR